MLLLWKIVMLNIAINVWLATFLSKIYSRDITLALLEGLTVYVRIHVFDQLTERAHETGVYGLQGASGT